MLLNPGKPGVDRNAPLIWLPFSSTRFPAALVTANPLRLRLRVPAPSCGAMYLWPYSASKPLYPPGSFGSTSGEADADGEVWPNLTALAVEHNALPEAQCTATPT